MKMNEKTKCRLFIVIFTAISLALAAAIIRYLVRLTASDPTAAVIIILGILAIAFCFGQWVKQEERAEPDKNGKEIQSEYDSA